MLFALMFIKLRGLLSVSMIVFAANNILLYTNKEKIKQYIKNPIYIGLTSIFFIVLFSGINTHDYNINVWLVWLRIKIPFLFMPFAFYVMPKIKIEKFYELLSRYVILAASVSFIFFINYLMHFKAINDSYKHAKIMPLPTEHIRFSVMICIAFFIGLYLIWKRIFALNKSLNFLIILSTIFLFLFIHILSVRSGLVSLYLGMILSLGYYIFYTKKYKIAIISITVLIALPIVAYWVLPSFQNKVLYMKHDITQYTSGKNISQFSDSRRIVSYKGGFQIWKKNFLFGVGYGDIREEMDNFYKINYPQLTDPEDRILPHNQFLWTAMGAGFIGLLLLIIVLLLPLLNVQNIREPLFGIFFMSQTISFMFEHTIEAQIGTAFFIIFICLIMHYVQIKQQKNTNEIE